MSSGTERGKINDRIVQLELELTQEQYALNQIPFHKQMAIVEISMNIAVIIIFLILTVICFSNPFGPVVGPLAAIIAFAATIYLIKSGIGKIKNLCKDTYGQETIRRQMKVDKLKKEIEELRKELKSMPLPTWNGS